MVNDVWRATAAGLPLGHPDHRDVRALPPTSLWWTLWIVYLVLGNIGARASFSDQPGQRIFPELEIALAVVSVAALICWIRVVLGLSRVQRTLAAGPAAPTAEPYPYAT